MSRRPPASLRRLRSWILLPALAGAVVSANVDAAAPPIVGPERVWAVLLVDGQAYFGHLDDGFASETIVLRDVYYLQDDRTSTTNVPVALAKRGGEVHRPADGTRIRRDRVLAIERVGPGSPVADAIAAQRALRALAGQ